MKALWYKKVSLIFSKESNKVPNGVMEREVKSVRDFITFFFFYKTLYGT